MIKCKVDIIEKMKAAGYNTNRIRKENILGQSMLQKIREGELPSWAAVDTICRCCNCQPGDLFEYVE